MFAVRMTLDRKRGEKIMSNLQNPQQQEHCFARLKARPLTAEEVDKVGGGNGYSHSITGPIEIISDTIVGGDSAEDCPRFS